MHRTEILLDKWQQRFDVRIGAIKNYTFCSDAASVYGRAIAFCRWQQDALADLGQASALPVCWALHRPNAGPSKRYLHDITFGLRTPPSALGAQRGYTPVSVLGPGCSGDFITICNRPIRRVELCMLARTRLGKVGLLYWPTVPQTWTTTASTAHPTAKLVGDGWRRASYPAPCSLCQTGNSLDFYHIFFECTLHHDPAQPVHPRDSLRQSCVQLLQAVTLLVVAAKDKLHRVQKSKGSDWLDVYRGDADTPTHPLRLCSRRLRRTGTHWRST